VRIRRRRAALAAVLGVLAVATGLNVALGDGTRSDPSAGPDAGDLSARELTGQRLVAGFKGHTPPRSLRRMIRGGELAGVILFSGNFEDREDARRLIRRLQSIRRPTDLRVPLLVMVDQEGGQVKRLPGPPTASAAEMGRRGGAFSRRQGRRTARNLRRAGVNVDLAPVLDVGRPGGAIREEGRSFGGTAERVSSTAVPFARGLEAGGIAATGKHFPGLGAAAANTDVAVERIELSKGTLRRIDEAPYEPFIGGGGELVMLSTAIYPSFSERPAAFARPIATTELRERLGFEGVAITDSLQSAAVRAFGGPARAGKAAAAAGADILLFSDYQAAARAGAALRRALRAHSLPRPEFEASAQRVLDLRARSK
jgi:beta-N-acetylhexosaminidase